MKAKEIIQSFKSLKDLKFEGPDADLDESLFNYGIIWAEEETDYVFIYRIYGENTDKEIHIGVDRFKKDTDVHKEFSWCDFEKLLNHLGTSKDEWGEYPLPVKISDIARYHGAENAFGTEYYPSVFPAITWFVADERGEIVYSGPDKKEAIAKNKSLPKNSSTIWWENDVTGDFEYV